MNKDVEIEVNQLIANYGKNAYREAVNRTVMAVKNNEAWAAKIFSQAALELMKLGYQND